MKPLTSPNTHPTLHADLPEKAKKIHNLLPQTQCQRCGWADCASYAQAIVEQQANINRCPPGGVAGIARIATALGEPALANALELEPDCGSETPLRVAIIDEGWCIGCPRCIKACPVDAIVGSHKKMHTVMEEHCTGCELCAIACPVDCIHMETTSEAKTGWGAWTQSQADKSLQRYEKRLSRIQGHSTAHAGTAALRSPAQTPPPAAAAPDKKQAVIAAALARARARKTQTQENTP